MAALPWDDAQLQPPAGLRLRTATWDDLDAVANLLATCSSAPGSGRPRPDDLRAQWLGLPDCSEILLLEITDASRGTPAVVGYTALEVDDDPWTHEVAVHTEVAVDPAWTRNGVGGYLLGIARMRARQVADAAGSPEATLRTALVDGDERSREWFRVRGFHAARHLLDFRLDLHAPPPASVWRDGVHARPFVPGRDEERLWRTHQAAFADVPTHLPLGLDEFLADRFGPDPGDIDPELVLLAEHGTGLDAETVGIAICRAGTPVGPHDGWVRDLGVVPAWRRYGIGMALLRTTFAAFRDRNLTGAALEVDDVTLDGAAALYRRAGMRTVRRTDVLVSRVSADVNGSA